MGALLRQLLVDPPPPHEYNPVLYLPAGEPSSRVYLWPGPGIGTKLTITTASLPCRIQSFLVGLYFLASELKLS